MFICMICEKAWDSIPTDARLVQTGHGGGDLYVIDRLAHVLKLIDLEQPAVEPSPYREVSRKESIDVKPDHTGKEEYDITN